jgi:ribosomal protein L7/L12
LFNSITTLLLTAVAAIVVLAVATLIVRRFWGDSVVEPTPFDQPSPPIRADQPPPIVTLTSSQEAQIRDLLAHGNKIEAIRQVRTFTALGLAEAKEWIEQIERGGAVAQPAPTLPTAMNSQKTDVQDDREVQLALAKGNKIVAIKRVRELTGVGLKEAKDYVDRLKS